MRAVAATEARPIDAEDVIVDLVPPDRMRRQHRLQVAVKAIPVNPVDARLGRAQAMIESGRTQGKIVVEGF